MATACAFHRAQLTFYHNTLSGNRRAKFDGNLVYNSGWMFKLVGETKVRTLTLMSIRVDTDDEHTSLTHHLHNRIAALRALTCTRTCFLPLHGFAFANSALLVFCHTRG